jgi:hypothetical protein
VVRPRTAVLVTAAALAGAATAPALGAPPARHFSTPVHVDENAADATGEPSIAVARDGTEYIVAPDGAGVRAPSTVGGGGRGGSLVWRSLDRGRSWVFLGSYDVPTGGGDTDIAVAPNGTVFASGLSNVACSSVAASSDKGQSWSVDPLAGCARVPLLNDRQWTAVDGNDTVYTSIGDPLEGNIDLIRSTPSVVGVTPTTSMEIYSGGDYEWPGTVSVDARNGTAYTVWNTAGAPDDCDGASGSSDCAPAAASTTTPDRIEISIVRRGATTAPSPVVVAQRRFDTYDSFVSDAVDAAGAVYVVWSERHPAQHQTWIMLSMSRNAGRTWTAPVRVSTSAQTAIFPSVTAGDSGRIAVSYYGTAGRGNSAQTVPGGSTWAVYSAFSTDGGRHLQTYRTTATMQRGPICTSGTGCAAGTRNVLDFFETAADPAGCLVTAYADNSSGGSSAVVSYVRQSSGPGLRAGRSCR